MMRLVVFCATHRGYLFLKKLRQLQPESELIVFSFREEPWEPPFMDDIRNFTAACGGKFLEARQVGAETLQPFWESNSADLMFAVNWRYIIPRAVFNRAKLGSYVFHDSLLPKYRGFSPTVWAIINGETQTGVTLFEISDAFDSGDIVDQQPVSIAVNETIATVMEHVNEAYLHLIQRNWEKLVTGTVTKTPQDHSQATYTCKRIPEDNQIDWAQSTESIFNLIRAVTMPYPGAFTFLDGRKIRIWSAERMAEPKLYVGGVPGRIVEIRNGTGSVILTGDGQLLLTKVQLEENAIVCASEVLKRIEQTLGR
jgi:methionyl-tRNA formyltransferase